MVASASMRALWTHFGCADSTLRFAGTGWNAATRLNYGDIEPASRFARTRANKLRRVLELQGKPARIGHGGRAIADQDPQRKLARGGFGQAVSLSCPIY